MTLKPLLALVCPLVCLALGLVAGEATAQAQLTAPDPCTPRHLPPIQVVFIRERPAVPVGVNGRYLYFMLDTGFTKTSVTPTVQVQLGLPVDNRFRSRASGTSGTTDLHFVQVGKLEFSGLSFSDGSYPVVAMDQRYGLQNEPDLFSGVVGGDLLRGYDVEFDFPNKIMRLFQPQACRPIRPMWNTPYKAIPIGVTTQNVVILPVQVNGFSLTALFDTGASSNVLALRSIQRAGIDPRTLDNSRMVVTSGAGGLPNKAWVHQLEMLEIAGDRFAKTRAIIQNFDLTEADMLLGQPYIRGRKIWLSYGSNVMFVEDQPLPR